MANINDNIIGHSTAADSMAAGTNDQRPPAPQIGMYRMNTTTGAPEWYDSVTTSWKPFGVALGETSDTAYRGDRGKTAYDHSQTAHAPSNAQKNSDITKAEIEAKLTGEIGTHTHAESNRNLLLARHLA